MEKIDETKETEGAEKKDTVGNTQEGNKSKTPKVIEDANAAAERMEAANVKREELLAREEALAAERQIGGTAEAGIQPPVKPKETDEEYADKFMKGEVNPLEDNVAK